MDDPVFQVAGRISDVSEGAALAVTLDGRDILLCKDEGQIFAIAARCSHADESLACGRIKYGAIACPAHGARFDLESGEPLNPPATVAIATYQVRISGDLIEVAL